MVRNANIHVDFKRSMRSVRSIFIPALIAAAISVANLSAAGKLSKDLDGIAPGTQVDVIIQFADTPSNSHLAAINRAGGVQKASFHGIHGGLFTVPAAALKGLAMNPEITYISPDR